MNLEQQFERLVTTLRLIEHEPWKWDVPRLELEFDVGSATVERDIRILRQWGIIKRENGYFAIEDMKAIPVILTPMESLAVVLAWSLVGEKIGIPFTNDIHTATAKIRAALPESMGSMIRGIQKRLTVGVNFVRDIDPETLHTISIAISNRTLLDIAYYETSQDELVNRRVCPYGLTFRFGSWYMIAYSHREHDVRTFNVARIHAIRTVNDSFEYPRDFDVEKYLRRAWRIQAHEGEEHVVLRFDKSIAPWIAGCTFHPNQKVSIEKDGSARFEVTVAGVYEIKHWVLNYGDKVEVMEPESLRTSVAETYRRMAAMYTSHRKSRLREPGAVPNAADDLQSAGQRKVSAAGFFGGQR